MWRLAYIRGVSLNQPSVTETPLHPDEPGGGGEFSEGRSSGCEHGSTVASTGVAKIPSCYTILREMDAGAPALPFADGGDHGETTEIRPDGQTRTLTDAVPAFEICGYKGKQVRGFVPTLTGLQFFDHSNMLLGTLWLYVRRTGYTCLQQRRRAASVVPRFGGT